MIVALLQARIGSTRLPGKVLKDICGKAMLEHEILRIKDSKLIDNVVLATTDKEQDEPVAKIGEKNGISVFRGSEKDVLDRFYQAAKKFEADIIVRLTGDCPLHDSAVIDKVIQFYLDNNDKYDYVSNVRPATYPDGMDVEVFPFSILENFWMEGKMPSDREHVTGFLARNLDLFRIGNVEHDQDVSSVRLTVDEPRDFELVKKIYSELYTKKNNFDLNDIMDLFSRRPELLKINEGIIMNEGYLKSLSEDPK